MGEPKNEQTNGRRRIFDKKNEWLSLSEVLKSFKIDSMWWCHNVAK